MNCFFLSHIFPPILFSISTMWCSRFLCSIFPFFSFQFTFISSAEASRPQLEFSPPPPLFSPYHCLAHTPPVLL
ncbi:unnamed protein product [Tuber melanosporum]|uniref:(Perigord truffle) hypothetical protein n=1 Tax=Tuber melanosporum (strain Mel28) TaxID=656061 RepID=D5GAN1_TUBMM|nr:uncharacterized protein GSTUM_00003698001 [Tuber melanosporum]CAZ81574.1 unnamed protein product [Tuber melanosporum]